MTPSRKMHDAVESCICEGLSNKEIAERLKITEHAVKWYVGILMYELGLYGAGDKRRLVVRLLEKKGRLK